MNINWRRIVVTGLTVGMVAVTGCSTNLPENNQGNRNGQRVTDAVNRRPDTYRHTNIGEETGNLVTRATRSLERGAERVVDTVENTTHRMNGHNNGQTRNSLNLGRPQGRIGNAFRYGAGATTKTPVTRSSTSRYTPSDAAHNLESTVSVNENVNRNIIAAPVEANRVDVKRSEVKNETKRETKTIDTKRGEKPVKKSHKASEEKTTRSSKPAPKLTLTHRVPPRQYDASLQTPFSVAPNLTLKPNATRKATPNRQAKAVRKAAQPTRKANAKRVQNMHHSAADMHHDQTVAVVNHTNDMAFFRKQVEEPTQTPEQNITPAPQSFNHFVETAPTTNPSTPVPTRTTAPATPSARAMK